MGGRDTSSFYFFLTYSGGTVTFDFLDGNSLIDFNPIIDYFQNSSIFLHFLPFKEDLVPLPTAKRVPKHRIKAVPPKEGFFSNALSKSQMRIGLG